LYFRGSLEEYGGGGCGGDCDKCGSKDLEGESLDLFQYTCIGQTLKRNKKISPIIDLNDTHPEYET
jgi:hypothetical protein